MFYCICLKIGYDRQLKRSKKKEILHNEKMERKKFR